MPNRPRRTPSSRRPPTPTAPAAAAAVHERPPAEPAAFLAHVSTLTNQRTAVRALVQAEVARLEAAAGAAPRRPLPDRVKRAVQLRALNAWRTAALGRLDDLQRNATGDAAGGQPLTPAHHQQVLALKRRLVVGLGRNASRQATLHGAQRKWHAAVKAARQGIAARRDTARDVLGAALPPDAQLHLKLARSTFMVEGNSPRLRRELQDATSAMPESKGLAYWRARYEVMAGRYPAAHAAIAGSRDYGPIRHTVMPLLEPATADAPWLSWPCNFYTYRYTLASDDQLRTMQGALAALANDSNVAATWLGLGIPQSAIDQLRDRAEDGAKALASLLLWNQANADFTRSKYASAVRNYEDCQRSIVAYFAARYPGLNLPVLSPRDDSGADISPAQQLESALDRLAGGLIDYNASTRAIWTYFRERYMTIALEELHTHDWRRPNVVPLAYTFAAPLPDYGTSTDFATAFARMLIQMGILKALQHSGEKVEEKIDAPLLAIALVFCPLAIAEANRLRRHFDEGLSQCRQLLARHASFKVLSEVIEKPFVKILKAQILLAKADGQYKARALAATPATTPSGDLRYQGLEAAETYQGVLTAFEDQGEYVNRVNAAVGAMTAELQGLLQHTFHPAASAAPAALPPLTPDHRKAFTLVGKTITVDTIVSQRGDYPEPDRRVRPHEPLIAFVPPTSGGGAPVLLETNPVVYALLLEARARLLQMESGLNYLGYSDDYVPPWRFQFLLDRARYFAEHAKNAQREYLNFLSNAEREEFQELTAAQNVEMEKSNIRVETARVDQVRLEVESSKASEELAALTAANAQARLDAYAAFDESADTASKVAGISVGASAIGAAAAGAVAGAVVGGPFGAAAGAVIGGAVGLLSSGGQAVAQIAQLYIANYQREYEEFSLSLEVGEADRSALVAQRQRAVAEAGLLVAGLQRAAAVVRHEFALQNLQYLRNRTLNAELWYRLSSSIRSVADTYLRYGIELAFLAEQAYEFEADKRLDVIRFDYDVSDLGDMLAGDFLLRDLDTLEQDLVVSQRIRQQQVRYVLSLSREFPEALQELRTRERATVSLRLEQLERRFPGLFNLRVASVEVLPLALMDTGRFSLALTHTGSGQVRLKAQPSEPPAAPGADWLQGLEAVWAVRTRTMGPETAVFSGLTRQDLAGGASFFAANQRGAFEGLPGASTWHVDLSMKENRIVPNTLADVLLTFTLSGYHDPMLRDAVDHAPRRPFATTTWFSAHQWFPDAYYQFNRTGRMEWQVRSEILGLQGALGAVRNLAVLGTPAQGRHELGRLCCAYPVEFEVDAGGGVRLLRELPAVAFTSSGLALDVTLSTPPGATVTFDFGDGTGWADSTALPHAYARPGRYDVLVRIAANGRLTEYHASVVVSRQHVVQPPCVALPVLNTTVSGSAVVIQPALQVPSGESLAESWRIDGREPDPGPGPTTFTLAPGRYVLRFSASRPLTGHFYGQQRHVPGTPVLLERLHVATNRTFDATTGTETTAALNAFGQHVFGGDALSPADRWTLDLPLDENPCLVSVTSTDTRQHDLGDLADVFLALEYEVGE